MKLIYFFIAVSDKFDGVAYYSKKFSDKEKYYPINICFALLAKFDGKKYTSDIEGMEWTEPMSLRDYSMINWEERYGENGEVIADCGTSSINKRVKTKNTRLFFKVRSIAYRKSRLEGFERRGAGKSRL